ncbi:hypothetical protein MMC07_002314 [Pseudocyphellaria aurata]|nr:hypothetical protein [Pseudocyphellaria aurata]
MPSSQTKFRLSTAVRIIIGVIIPVIFIAIVILAIICWRRYRSRRRLEYGLTKNNNIALGDRQRVVERGNQGWHEMADEHKRQEAPAGDMRHQMLADERRPELGDHSHSDRARAAR